MNVFFNNLRQETRDKFILDSRISQEQKQDIHDFFCDTYDETLESDAAIQLMREPLIDFDNTSMETEERAQYVSDRWGNLNTCLNAIEKEMFAVKPVPLKKRTRRPIHFSHRKEKRRNKSNSITVEIIDLTFDEDEDEEE